MQINQKRLYLLFQYYSYSLVTFSITKVKMRLVIKEDSVEASQYISEYIICKLCLFLFFTPSFIGVSY